MQTERDNEKVPVNGTAAAIMGIAFKDAGPAMGVTVAVRSFLDRIGTQSAIGMLGIGLVCAVNASLIDKQE